MQTIAASADETRRRVYATLGAFVHALGAPVRLKLVQLLAQAPRSVEALAAEAGETVANTSQHLQRLTHAGVTAAARAGLTRVYRLRSPRVAALWEQLQDVAHELEPALDRAADALTDARLRAPLPAAQVLAAVAAGRAVLLDVRQPAEAAATPVPQARCIPLARLRAALPTLPAHRPIYVFCRGRYCHLASDAVRLLRRAGLRAYRLQESACKLNAVREDA